MTFCANSAHSYEQMGTAFKQISAKVVFFLDSTDRYFYENWSSNAIKCNKQN